MNRERARSKRRRPPPKQPGKATGARRIDGAWLLDVTSASALLGLTEKAIRARIERGLLPYRRLGPGRIVFLRAERERYIAGLDGCSLEQALATMTARSEGAAS